MIKNITPVKFHLGRDLETKVFRTLVFCLAGDKERFFAPKPDLAWGLLWYAHL